MKSHKFLRFIKIINLFVILFIVDSINISAQCLNKELSKILINYIEFQQLAEHRERCLSYENINCNNIFEYATKCTIPKYKEYCNCIQFKDVSFTCVSIEFSMVSFNNGMVSASTGPNVSRFLAISDSVAFEFKMVNTMQEYNMILEYCETNREAAKLLDSIYKVLNIQTIKTIEISNNSEMFSIFDSSHSKPILVLYFRKGKVYKTAAS